MTLPWEDTKRLARLHGIASELLSSARGSSSEAMSEGIERQLARVGAEVTLMLAASDEEMAEEFERVVIGGAGSPLPPEVQAAAMAGWLSSTLALESLEEKVRQNLQAQAEAATPPSRWRKQTVGFKVRAPITRAQDETGPS